MNSITPVEARQKNDRPEIEAVVLSNHVLEQSRHAQHDLQNYFASIQLIMLRSSLPTVSTVEL